MDPTLSKRAPDINAEGVPFLSPLKIRRVPISCILYRQLAFQQKAVEGRWLFLQGHTTHQETADDRAQELAHVHIHSGLSLVRWLAVKIRRNRNMAIGLPIWLFPGTCSGSNLIRSE
jgi:hypothetical protein